MISKLLYLLRESVRGFFHNKFMTFAVIGNIALSLFFVGCFLVALLNLDRLIESAAQRITFEAFLEDESADTEILNREILSTEGVLGTEYISKKQAYEIFKKEVGEDILKAVEGNPLPASFIVHIDRNFRSPEKLETIRENLKRIPFVSEVSSVQDWAPRLHRTRNLFATLSLISILILSCAVFFMVASTIRITFMTRHDFVEVLTLIGASNSLIRIPFLIEGFLKGLLGGALSYLLLLTAVFFARRFLPDLLLFGKVFFFLSAAGALIGFLASVKSVRIRRKG
ncbi:MAG: hypothetical protein A2293_05305 [Elusimicrobia bacterium RIFOXYB2_FULL_49_7]|nr:MAG: hypothetical protein A2293_05305 [Elusimicrobia bacterium RIFOXYB2_FULL_49_7]HLD29717.1 permease-like cell division protein FtsX [bacterium]